jgi:hypothetical protein
VKDLAYVIIRAENSAWAFFRIRHVDGIGKTGFYRPATLLVIPWVNLSVIILNHLFLEKTGIFEYF